MTQNNSYQAELKAAKQAARYAAEICQAVHKDMIQTAEKSGREPVTVADYAAQAAINATLKDAFPDDHILGEEHGSEFEQVLNVAQRQQVVHFVGHILNSAHTEDDIKTWLSPPSGTSERTWIIDPIDGTKGFINGRSYAVAIALLEDNALKLGVLACPNLSLKNPGEKSEDGEGVLFYAVQNGGAYRELLSDANAEAVKITVTDTQADQALILSTSYEKKHTDSCFFEQTVKNLSAPQITKIGMDGQGKYGLVADGRVSAYFRLVPEANYREKVWDHAAGAIIVSEAGGQVSDFHGQPLDFSLGKKLSNNRGIVATNGHIHPAVLKAIAKTGWDAEQQSH